MDYCEAFSIHNIWDLNFLGKAKVLLLHFSSRIGLHRNYRIIKRVMFEVTIFGFLVKLLDKLFNSFIFFFGALFHKLVHGGH